MHDHTHIVDHPLFSPLCTLIINPSASIGSYRWFISASIGSYWWSISAFIGSYRFLSCVGINYRFWTLSGVSACFGCAQKQFSIYLNWFTFYIYDRRCEYVKIIWAMITMFWVFNKGYFYDWISALRTHLVIWATLITWMSLFHEWSL